MGVIDRAKRVFCATNYRQGVGPKINVALLDKAA